MGRVILSARQLAVSGITAGSRRWKNFELCDDLLIRRGEICGIQGESGVGKTEFLRLIVDQLLRSKSIRLQYIAQNLPFFPEISLKANVRALGSGATIAEVVRVAPHLEAVLQGRGNWSIATLSGGERRQVALVAALLGQNNLVVLDETLVSLDGNRLRWALSVIREFLRNGRVGGVLLISHDSRVLDCCDSVFRMGVVGDRRVLEKVASRKVIADRVEVAPAEELRSSTLQPNRLYSLFRSIAGFVLAFGLLLLLMVSPRQFASAGILAVIPSIQDVKNTLFEERNLILRHAWWSFQNSIVSLFCMLLLSGLFWLLTSISDNTRRILSSAWIAFQAVPVILFSPLIVIIFGYSGRFLEIAIAVFIAVFPLGLLGARAIASTPEDIFRAHSAVSAARRFSVAVRFSRSDLLRGIIACSPLPAVGVIVAEYLIRERGLGFLVHRGLTESVSFTKAYAYVISCAGLSFLVVFTAILATLPLLPRDVAAD